MSQLLRRVCFAGLFVLFAVVSAQARDLQIAWDPNPEPDIAGYIVRYGTAPGRYGVTVDVGNHTGWTLTALEPRTAYYVTVEAYNTVGLRSDRAAELTIVADEPVCGSELSTTTATFGAGLGTQTVNVTAQDECSWSVTSYASWISVTSGSSSTGNAAVALTVAPNVSTSGRAGVVSIAGNTVSVIQHSPIAVTRLVADNIFPVLSGKTVTWTAQAVGGTGPLLFKFMLFSKTAGWQVLRDYTTSNAVTWTAGPPDQHALQVWVKSTGSPNALDAYRAFGSFEISRNSVKSVSLAPNVSTSIRAGTLIEWSAESQGGIGPIQYEFWVRDTASGWNRQQAYGATSKFSWRPLQPGTYTVQVWARSAGSTLAYEAYRSSGVLSVTPRPTTVISLSSSLRLPAAPEVPITWTATAAGPGPLEYQFWVWDESLGWLKARDYGPSPRFTWTPTLEGTYAVQVWVRQTGQTVAYESYGATGALLIAAGPVGPVRLVSNQRFPLPTNTTITWSASASGGSAALEYAFWRYTLGSWTRVQAYGPASIYSWTPGPDDIGTHVIQVWVRSAGSSSAYERWAGSGPISVVP